MNHFSWPVSATSHGRALLTQRKCSTLLCSLLALCSCSAPFGRERLLVLRDSWRCFHKYYCALPPFAAAVAEGVTGPASLSHHVHNCLRRRPAARWEAATGGEKEVQAVSRPCHACVRTCASYSKRKESYCKPWRGRWDGGCTVVASYPFLTVSCVDGVIDRPFYGVYLHLRGSPCAYSQTQAASFFRKMNRHGPRAHGHAREAAARG